MVEVSLGLALFCIVFGSSITFMLKINEMQQQITTDRNMWIIISSLIGFVKRNGRLPYPSKSDGIEFDHPEDEKEWKTNWRKYNKGAIPWKTLGISEIYSKDGKGKSYTYIVDPTLCGRKNVKSVPIGDIREVVDFDEEAFGHFINTKNGIEGVIGNSDKLIDSIKPFAENFCSYRAVRSYLDDFGYSTGTKTRCWDIASKIKECKISLYKNKKSIDTEKRYFLISKTKKSDPLKKSMKEEVGTFASLEKTDDVSFFSAMETFLPNDSSEESPYRVDDFIAFVIISYKQKKNSFNKQKTEMFQRFDLKNKLEEKSQENPESNIVHLDKKNRDVVVFFYRFQIIDMINIFTTSSFMNEQEKFAQKYLGFNIVNI